MAKESNSKKNIPKTDFDDNAVRVWEKIIDEQIHFNEIKSKNQTLFVSIITASIAAAGYLSTQKLDPSSLNVPFLCCSFRIYSYTIPIIGAALFTLAFFILDVGVYHTLLKGAVKCGQAFEKEYLSEYLPSIAIEHHSTNDRTFGFIRGASNKHYWFYGLIGASLFLLSIVLNIN